MASPIREVIEQRDYAAIRAGARTALSPWCRPDGAVGFPLAAHVVSGRKA
jgi:hypothetical protein